MTFLAAYLIPMTCPHQLKILKKYCLQERGGHRAASAKEGMALQKYSQNTSVKTGKKLTAKLLKHVHHIQIRGKNVIFGP